MDVTVLYFAAVRELVGLASETLSLPDGVRSVKALRAHLESVHPSLAGRLAQVRIARNESFAADDEAVAAGDEIALIPPVAGGRS